MWARLSLPRRNRGLSCHAKAHLLFVVQEIKEMQSEKSADFIADALEVSEQLL